MSTFYRSVWSWIFALAVCTRVFVFSEVVADDTPPTPAAEPAGAQASPALTAAEQPAEEPAAKPTLVRLAKDYDVWMDPKRKLVVVDGKVCLREGQLEMFACPKGTKEHESIVSVNCPAQFVHAGLVAVGAEPGTPVQFDPVYQPATGPKVEVILLWIDEKGGRHKDRAQDWIRHVKTDKPMPYDFVFGGSGFVVDQHTGKNIYMADGGELICVSNFTTAMLDLPVESSQSNADLLFDAYTEKIPPLGTKVRIVLIPEVKEKAEAAKPE